jgi:hypothetical protein
VRWVDRSGAGGRGSSGRNPPYGAVIHYLLPEALDAEDSAEVKLEILDDAGEVLRSLSSQTPEPQAPSPWRRFFPELAEPPLLDARAGANSHVWGLTLADAGLVDDAVLWGWPGGPLVPPGSYEARLTVGDWSDTVRFEVVPDPRIEVEQEAIEAQFELSRDIWQALTRTHETITRIRDLRAQVEAVSGRADDENVTARAEEITQALTAIEEELTQVKNESSQDVLNFPPQLDNQLLSLQSVVESTLGPPLESSRQLFAALESELEAHIADLEAVVAEQLPELERLLEEAGAARVAVP